MSSLPLSGVRVLDLTRLLPGPFATLVLADLGADVVKLEDPDGGDSLRAMPPLAGAASGYFHALNRNKRSLALDLAAAGGAAAFLKLARTFDVVVESFRPGVLDRLGCGWEALQAASPRAILCSITGYGQTGPYRGLAGHDLDYCAIAGVLARNGPSEAPLPLGVQAADLAGGAWPAVAGILAALVRRAATGEGARVDISMTEGALALLAMAHGGAALGEPLGRGAGALDGARASYGIYRTADGGFVALAALEPHFFRRFCESVARPELAAAQLDGAGPRAELEAIFAQRTREEWAAFGLEHDVCLAPVLEPLEAREDPQLRSRGAFITVETPWEGRALPGVATPVRIEGAPAPLRPAPRLGEGGDDVLREAGFTPEEVATLRASGALAPGSA